MRKHSKLEPAVPSPPAVSPGPRVLVATHSHPRYVKGGAELAAYTLYEHLRREGREAWFLGCVRGIGPQRTGATLSQPTGEREYLYSAGEFDWFKFANRDPKFPAEFRRLLETLQPTVVHFHHYLNFGVEAFLHVKETLPNCKVVLTLHEYLAICNHYGQMVTRERQVLCHEATPDRCSRCFPEIPPTDFFLRKHYVQQFFALVDHFISPSEFLAARYRAWGVPAHKLSVIENVMPPVGPALAPPRPLPDEGTPLRVGFFGQISHLKGINVLLEAAAILAEQRQYGVTFEIHGDYSGQPPEFQKDYLERLAKVGRNVKYYGPYESERVDALMRQVDVVLVPSIWWENSPLVIQEALRNGVPILCSDIGGMAEKVRDGIDGMHLPMGNPVALAQRLLAQSLKRGGQVGASPPASPSIAYAQHEAVYR